MFICPAFDSFSYLFLFHVSHLKFVLLLFQTKSLLLSSYQGQSKHMLQTFLIKEILTVYNEHSLKANVLSTVCINGPSLFRHTLVNYSDGPEDNLIPFHDLHIQWLINYKGGPLQFFVNLSVIITDNYHHKLLMSFDLSLLPYSHIHIFFLPSFLILQFLVFYSYPL